MLNEIYKLINIIDQNVDSAFYRSWDSKMSISFRAEQ